MPKNPKDDVANYRDPEPDFSKMGWGRKDLNVSQNRVIEARSQEELPNVVLAKNAEGASAMIPSIEKAIRAKFQFDEGWDFTVAEELVYGLALWFAQLIGNCVGASHVMLIAARVAHEILAEGEAEDPLGSGLMAMPFCPYSYGVGRWVGGMLGPGDGSYCGAQIEGTMEHGFLLCGTPGLEKYAGSGDAALPQGTASAGRLFGKSKAEIQKWTSYAKEFDLVEAPKCKSVDDATELMEKKFVPIQICSGWGFQFKSKDPTTGVNVYVKSGSWSHSMQLVKSFRIKGKGYKTVRNQWGKDAHKDGTTFTIEDETADKWIKNAEAIGIGQIKGLPQNPGF